ncbi:cysteine--tRNA ligase [Brevibacterium sp. 91QC2O2]|uniref:cysteine--tRNA ligase n=1 Tax=Brevibacterium sp. 91QC2O2 TaxID=2968458 RepID=UPI00211BBFD7|nr:cysteine--tRNA ligase [Brevibacterium sp. 91QC2O2]
MTIALYNTQTRTVEQLRPITPGRVGIYVCGATVQGAPHIGHMRSAVVFDQLRRWLTYRGLDVTLIRNVTDIDDKILSKSVEEGRTWFAHAYHYERVFTAAYEAMGVLAPDYEPRATGHVPEMIELIGRLIDAGHAYPAADDSGDVYFDTASWPDYGELTHQRPADMSPADDAPRYGKRSPQDFALWKGHKQGEPLTASWNTPWGRGRPGWHIECSAMSTKYLGAEFDIHGGGLDLRFPHHENELAQSRAAGDPFARLWMHSGLLTVGGDKMSKSLGNSIFAHELFAKLPALTVRYFLSTAHYRSVLDFTEAAVAGQQTALDRFANLLSRARGLLGEAAPAVPSAADGYAGVAARVPDAFAAAMDDDLAIPQALAVAFEHLGAGFRALEIASAPGAGAQTRADLAQIVGELELMLDILGVNPTDPHWATGAGGDDAAHAALDALVGALAEERLAAKAEKDYARADGIRARLAEAGVAIEDTPAGYRWQLKDEEQD